MKLFKNVPLEDLESVLRLGILPISEIGNDNWAEGKRANNSTDVVYLFSPINELNSFIQYGSVLLEIELETATKNEIWENDVNKDRYEEYITSEVKAEEIRNIYIPIFLKRFVDKEIIDKVTFVDVTSNCYAFNSETAEMEKRAFSKKDYEKFENLEPYFIDKNYLELTEEVEYIHPLFNTKRKNLYRFNLIDVRYEI